MRFLDWKVVLLLALLLGLLCSCRTQYVPVETVQTDSIYINRYARDSIYFRDSVFVHTKADTVFLNRVQYKYREMIVRDTVYKSKCDTTTVVREIERELTKLQQTQMDIGRGVMWAIPMIIALWLLYRKFLK